MDTGKVLIVGGGIGGLSTAIALRDSGFDVKVFERSVEHREVGSSFSLWPNALLALDSVGGAANIVDNHTATKIGISRTHEGKEIARVNFEALGQRFGMPMVQMHRADLHLRLLEQVDPESVLLGRRAVSYDQDNDSASITFSDGTTEKGDVVIVADGGNSVLRRQMFPGDSLIYAGRTSWRACLYDADPGLAPEATVIETQGIGARMGLARLDGNRIGWWANLTIPEEEAETIGPAKNRLLQEMISWPYPIGQVISGTEPEHIVMTKITRFASRDSWSDGRVVLIGDAAHAMSPDLGQGGCQAVEDGVVLGQCLQRAADVPSAIADYEDRRIERANMLVDRSAALGKVSNWKHPALCWLRSRALSLMPAKTTSDQMYNMLYAEF